MLPWPWNQGLSSHTFQKSPGGLQDTADVLEDVHDPKSQLTSWLNISIPDQNANTSLTCSPAEESGGPHSVHPTTAHGSTYHSALRHRCGQGPPGVTSTLLSSQQSEARTFQTNCPCDRQQNLVRSSEEASTWMGACRAAAQLLQ